MDDFDYYGIDDEDPQLEEEIDISEYLPDESKKEEIDMSEYFFEEAKREYEEELDRYYFIGTPIKPDDDFESMEYLPG